MLYIWIISSLIVATIICPIWNDYIEEVIMITDNKYKELREDHPIVFKICCYMALLILIAGGPLTLLKFLIDGINGY